MLRVAFDTVVFVRALINPLGLWGRLVFEYADAYRLIVSRPTLLEVLLVIRRPRLTRKYQGLATREPRAILARLSAAEVVDPEKIAPVSRDPNDDKFVATVKAAGADYLMTEDNDLLVLGQYDGTRIVTGAAVLEILERQVG